MRLYLTSASSCTRVRGLAQADGLANASNYLPSPAVSKCAPLYGHTQFPRGHKFDIFKLETDVETQPFAAPTTSEGSPSGRVQPRAAPALRGATRTGSRRGAAVDVARRQTVASGGTSALDDVEHALDALKEFRLVAV